MASAPDEPPAWKRGLRGFAEGVVVAAVAVMLITLLSRRGFRGRWPEMLVTAGAGGLVFGVGRAVARSATGSFVGAFLGAVLGIVLGSFIPWQRTRAISLLDEQGQEMDVHGPTLDGKEFDLKQWRGKVVLADFWATWCGPCRAELPHVKAVYDKYHDQGFEVVGVSLDNSRERLDDFVKREELPWPQVFFDEDGKRGWDNPLARQHGVDAIPATFLLDREGRVASTNVHGAALEKAVAHLLKQRASSAERFRMENVPLGLYAGLGVGLVLGAVTGAVVQRRLRPPPPAPGATP